MYKTNVMRVLDKMKLDYKSYDYADTDAISGIDVANAMNQDPGQVFKTLVTISKSNRYYVFMIPVAEELDLKKAAETATDLKPGVELLEQALVSTIKTAPSTVSPILQKIGKGALNTAK